MRCPSKCGDVILSMEFVLGNADYIEIMCFFCTHSYKSLESFGGHLKNTHKWLLEAISDYYQAKNKENSNEHINKENDHYIYTELHEMKYDIDELAHKTDKLVVGVSTHDGLNQGTYLNGVTGCSENKSQSSRYKSHNAETGSKEVSSKLRRTKALQSSTTKSHNEEDPLIGDKDERHSIENKIDNDDWVPSDGDWVPPKPRQKCKLFTSKAAEEALMVELISQMEKYPILWMYRDLETSKISLRKETTKQVYKYLREKFTTERFREKFISRKLELLRHQFYRSEVGKIPLSSVPFHERLGFLKGNVGKPIRKTNEAASSSGRFECPHCSKNYAQRGSLINHMRAHQPQSRMKCDFCDKYFVLRYELEQHIRIHTNEKPFICEMCGKSFRKKNQLALHINKVHLRLRAYKCELCPKAFQQRIYLTDHMNMHLNLQPWRCDLCEKRFTTKPALKYHIKNHLKPHDEFKKFKCLLCDKTYLVASSRQRHLKRAHGKQSK